MDIEKYTAKFLDETGENLSILERALAAMAKGQADDEVRDTAHRAAHSIKGSARIFGFDRIAQLAEELEVVLRHVMRKRLAVTPELSSTLDNSKETLRHLVIASKTGIAVDDGFESPLIATLQSISGPLNLDD
jgi:two-component system, chemotaxis family, sensor kinase CheA